MWYYDGYQLDVLRNTKVDIAIQKKHNQLEIPIF
jgi:hypothetical protein